MAAVVRFADVEVGQELPTLTMSFTRDDLNAYAIASGDMNPIHRDEAFARSVGLPDVIAHGMLTMGRAIKVVTDWVSDPAAVTEYSVRMTRPVVVPDTSEGVVVTFGGKVVSLDEAGHCAKIELTALFEDQTVLGQARATVVLS
jgi:acyl dehydratase